jgi:hypothetical protein
MYGYISAHIVLIVSPYKTQNPTKLPTDANHNLTTGVTPVHCKKPTNAIFSGALQKTTLSTTYLPSLN